MWIALEDIKVYHRSVAVGQFTDQSVQLVTGYLLCLWLLVVGDLNDHRVLIYEQQLLPSSKEATSQIPKTVMRNIWT